jgi:hypothetical protein
VSLNQINTKKGLNGRILSNPNHILPCNLPNKQKAVNAKKGSFNVDLSNPLKSRHRIISVLVPKREKFC